MENKKEEVLNRLDLAIKYQEIAAICKSEEIMNKLKIEEIQKYLKNLSEIQQILIRDNNQLDEENSKNFMSLDKRFLAFGYNKYEETKQEIIKKIGHIQQLTNILLNVRIRNKYSC